MSPDVKPKPCYRDRDNGVRFIKSEHAHDCGDTDCRGCKVCPESNHCTARKNCSWHIPAGELTCGRCIAAPRRHIKWIEALSSLMLTQAIADGIDSQATVLAGPAADPRGHSARRLAEKRFLRAYEGLGRISEEQHLAALESMDDEDWQHAYSVLTRYQLMFSEDYDHDLPARMSVSGAAAYLDRNLHRIAQDPEQDFAELAANLKKCCQHLEVVLHNDDRPERGAPCPACYEGGNDKPPRLSRTYAERWEADDDSRDEWRCPRNREHAWSEADYRLRVADWHEETKTSA